MEAGLCAAAEDSAPPPLPSAARSTREVRPGASPLSPSMTHTLRTLVETAQGEGAVVALAAPTGKAAKRLEETTGQAAMTVHRLIRQETVSSTTPAC
ncbi:AAA family ATPase [Streptomyces pratensis]|uniref:AAA family ATPase n=1 Tax=Streptomyces pratensis TaxID=1169025 RepID=UPI0036301014